MKREKDQENTENKHNEEIQEITSRFNKEILTLQEKLQETTTALDKANVERLNMSKKRGYFVDECVCV